MHQHLQSAGLESLHERCLTADALSYELAAGCVAGRDLRRGAYAGCLTADYVHESVTCGGGGGQMLLFQTLVQTLVQFLVQTLVQTLLQTLVQTLVQTLREGSRGRVKPTPHMHTPYVLPSWLRRQGRHTGAHLHTGFAHPLAFQGIPFGGPGVVFGFHLGYTR